MSVEQDVFGDQYESASRYVDILATRGIEWGLIGPREGDRLWDRHVLNSVAPAALLPPGATVADVGSGAGLPGIPLALLRPDLRVTLVEPLLRRATFLTEAVEELDLGDRVSVVRARAEDHRERYDAVVSRALAPLPRLLAWCEPLRQPDGVILALKGRSASDELAEAERELQRRGLVGEVLTVRAHPSVEPTSVVRLRAGR
ncbi:16S rRNA (guanine(527)-N(7))-methyltransferase RsmG [Microlunatus capsulatus]|uniref:Ribosomal RNA small subunit methyltransferase G n=1 Tax=Microlunatus capsulatus TaxID=99117 RepID=A0ABS4Z8H0_9ACTN|nr:16S rRNA (guanine(527)-N(7))-methyltransferase RsmG [Microlunatus capsulatus]MBP2417306.1 16S rRNA (guanine527-N7)-methyltransferase [Microlunatus capsulatus]